MQLEQLINDRYDLLNDNDLHIWKYVSTHKKECEKLSIDDLATKCNVSRTTILRFSKRLGLKGYAEFKVYLRMANNMYDSGLDGTIKLHDNYSNYLNTLMNKDFTSVVEKIYKAKNLYLYGTGSIQNNAAAEIKRTFLNVGKLFIRMNSRGETEAYEKLIDKDDLIIIISYSGKNKRMLEFVRKMVIKNVTIISITINNENELSRLADEALYVDVPNISNPLGPIYNGLCNYFLLIDFLLVNYMSIANRIGDKHEY